MSPRLALDTACGAGRPYTGHLPYLSPDGRKMGLAVAVMHSLMCAAPPDGNTNYLVVCAAQKRARAEERARGEPVEKVVPVDRVERVVQSEVRTEDLHRHDIVHGQSRGLHRRLDAVHDPFGLDPRILRGSAGLRVYPDMAGDIERVANEYSIAERQRRTRGAAFAIYKPSISIRRSRVRPEGEHQGND